MRFKKVEDLTKDQIVLLKKGPPAKRPSREMFRYVATLALEVLADPLVGREKFSMQAIVDKANSKKSKRARISVGVPYNYFANPVDLMEFVWPDRADKFFTGTIEDRRV